MLKMNFFCRYKSQGEIWMHSAPKLPMPIPPKPRARLSEAQVIEIFRARASASTSTEVASVYTVSEKAIRDIWKGRTWSRETLHLDMSRPFQLKTVGRPKGCKDRQPRKKRARSHDDLSATTWTLSNASVDEQLHEWDSFWRCSSGTDPFCGDWDPCES